MKHIGMDLHGTTTDVCVRNGRGKIVLRRQIATTKAELEKLIAGIQGLKRVAVEESQMADWVTRVLKPHVDEVIRCQPRFNKLISESEDKCDKTDSESLSELLYLNRLKRVHHPELVYRTLREAVRAYWIASRELTRAKNRVKAFFLFNGLRETGNTIYAVRNRSGNLAKLGKLEGNVELARLLYERLDHCRQLKAKHILVPRQSARPVKGGSTTLSPGWGGHRCVSCISSIRSGFPSARRTAEEPYAGKSTCTVPRGAGRQLVLSHREHPAYSTRAQARGWIRKQCGALEGMCVKLRRLLLL